MAEQVTLTTKTKSRPSLFDTGGFVLRLGPLQCDLQATASFGYSVKTKGNIEKLETRVTLMDKILYQTHWTCDKLQLLMLLYPNLWQVYVRMLQRLLVTLCNSSGNTTLTLFAVVKKFPSMERNTISQISLLKIKHFNTGLIGRSAVLMLGRSIFPAIISYSTSNVVSR